MTRAKIRPLAVQKKKDGLYKIQTVKLKLNYHIISIQIGIIFNLYKNVPSIFTHNKDFLATRSSNGNRVSFTALTTNVNLYHVTTFTLYLLLTAHYQYTEISCFTPVLSMKIALAAFVSSFSILRNSQLRSDVCRLPLIY